MTHPVAFHEQGTIQRLRGDVFVIVGAVRIRGAVHAAADIGEWLEIVSRYVFRPIEHQVFEQMGKPATPRRFVLGTDIIGDADQNHRGVAVVMHQNAQPVGQRETVIGDIHLIDEATDIRACKGSVCIRVFGRRRDHRLRHGWRCHQREEEGAAHQDVA
nr:hypothetical protein [Sphingomonas sp. BT553]